MNEDPINAALSECYTYNRMGALDESVLEDISHDHEIDLKRLKKALGWVS